MNDEILLINKRKGITSFDVIRILRRKLGIRKMGHAGTLDPMATGLMIIGINKGTKKLNDFLKLDKSYTAEVLIGTKTDSGDLEGEIIEELIINNEELIEEKKIIEILESLVGEIELSVPRFSAIKVNGQKLYDKARKGQDFEPPKRIMKIYSIKFNDLKFENGKAYLNISLDVGSGTYIRSIAEEIGRKLNFPATLSNLCRTKIGEFTLENAESLE